MNRIWFCLILAAAGWTAVLLADRATLREELIRFHVVANSDSAEDQSIKLQVRDAVIESIQKDLERVSDIDAAKAYIQENIPKIQETAERALETAGVDSQAVVTLCKEAFDTRHYDTFSLPSGVYESLRIVIGEGEGHNWWCVAFPSLCVPATEADFEEVAVGAGFSDSLSQTLSKAGSYEVRFYLLDQLGKLENIFFEG